MLIEESEGIIPFWNSSRTRCPDREVDLDYVKTDSHSLEAHK